MAKRHYTGEKRKQSIVSKYKEEVFQGIHYYKNERFRFTLLTFKKAAVRYEEDTNGEFVMVNPRPGTIKHKALMGKLETIYHQKIIEVEKKHNIKLDRLARENEVRSSIKDVMKQWIVSGRKNKASTTVRNFYEPMVERYFDVNENHRLNDISHVHVEKFKKSLSAMTVPKKTKSENPAPPSETSLEYRNIHLKTLRTFLNWAFKKKNRKGQQYLNEVPEIRLFQVTEKPQELFNENELCRLINHLDSLLTGNIPWRKLNKRRARFCLLHQRFLILLLGTGFRRSEAAFLEWNEINFETGLITVRAKPEFNFKTKGKNESTRLILPDSLRYLKEQRELYPDEKYVLDTNGKPAFVEPHALSTAFLRYKKEIGLNPKAEAILSIRAFFASLAEHCEISPFTIQQMMGHSSIEKTMTYLGRSTKHLRQTIVSTSEEAKRLFRKDDKKQ
jgi:integrase